MPVHRGREAVELVVQFPAERRDQLAPVAFRSERAVPACPVEPARALLRHAPPEPWPEIFAVVADVCDPREMIDARPSGAEPLVERNIGHPREMTDRVVGPVAQAGYLHRCRLSKRPDDRGHWVRVIDEPGVRA
jgi:hypothetical protein